MEKLNFKIHSINLNKTKNSVKQAHNFINYIKVNYKKFAKEIDFVNEDDVDGFFNSGILIDQALGYSINLYTEGCELQKIELEYCGNYFHDMKKLPLLTFFPDDIKCIKP